MSFVRVNRCGPRVGVRKTLKVKKKKASVKQEWDNTVTDLTVHRSTPEDLVRRHEIHKSKNRALVHWELQEKALKRKLRKQKPETSNLEKRRLSIMKEILSDQYQTQDVLEKSDHRISAAKELFPRRCTGFPNITVAPDSSQSPTVVNQDPITQSIFNEPVREPQALNDVDGEEEGTVNSQSGESEDENELDNSLNSQSNTNTNRFLQQLTEENSELINKLWTDTQQKIATQSQITPPGTPPSALASGEQRAALNATSAVRRLQSRLQPQEATETLDSSSVVGHMLNSRKPKQLLNKVKRKPNLHALSKPKKNTLSGSTSSADLPKRTNSTLDVLQHMIHEVEHEVEEYERCTGREVKGLGSSQGLSGFTLSLVSSLCRLVRYLKEARLQQYMVTTDEHLLSLTHAVKNCPVINNRQEIQASERGATGRRVADSPEGPAVNASVSVPLVFGEEEVAGFPQEELPVRLSQVPNAPESMNLAKNFPAHVFEPAVLLTPPRQKSNSEFSPLQDVLRRTVQTRPAPRIPPTVEIIEKEQNWEKKTLPIDTDVQNSREESRLFTQRWRVSHMGEDLEKTQSPLVNLSQPFCNSHSNRQHSRNPPFSEEPPALGDGQQLRTNEMNALIQRKDIVARIAELTLQNPGIKAHMNNTVEPGGEQGDRLREAKKQESASGMTSTFPVAQSLASGSMEERIAELNRQSLEARGKLLQLIEQQKLVGLNPSPPTSPVQLPLRAWTEGGKRTIEVSIPGAEAPESSKCSTISPVSGINTRRSSGATSNSCSPLNATSGSGRLTPLNPRAKIEKQNEEGWFALSTHVS
uniref:Spindle and centriole-associated protein 1 n=1 Tax=Callithrix jacchus TaxID=9483 RepID=A0A8I3WNS0_CALJA